MILPFLIVVHADVYRETHGTGSTLHVKGVWEEKSPSAQQISTSQFRTENESNVIQPLDEITTMEPPKKVHCKPHYTMRALVLQIPQSGHPVPRAAVLHPHPHCHIRFVDVIITTIMT